MIKYLVTSAIIIFSLSFNSGFGQQNNIWMLGLNSSSSGENCGIDFNSGQADTFSFVRPMSFWYTNSSVCDSLGTLLFYTNGVSIANRLHLPLLNEANFNPGYSSTLSPSGLQFYDECVIISKPDNNWKYFILHESADTVNFGSYTYPVPLSLSYSEIDMSLDGSLGGINPLRKSVHLIDDTLMIGKLSAIKHANGRDWWVVTHKLNSSIFYTVLITPDSIFPIQSQTIGSYIPIVVFGQSAFSPDGKKYVVQSSDTSIELFDFDRCAGLFSNPIPIVIADSVLVLTGEAFSKSSRFLYVNNNIYIRQFDLYSANIPASGQIVAVWDGSLPHSRFRVNRLAPDGRIYLTTRDGGTTIHYIESPDSLGMACNVRQNGLITPSANVFSFPNLPDFNLGPDSLSVCDSLFNFIDDRIFADLVVEVYPNPFSKSLTLHSHSPMNVELKLYNSLGSLLLTRKFRDKIDLDLSFLSPGTYQLELISEKSVVMKRVIKAN